MMIDESVALDICGMLKNLTFVPRGNQHTVKARSRWWSKLQFLFLFFKKFVFSNRQPFPNNSKIITYEWFKNNSIFMYEPVKSNTLDNQR